MTKADESNKQAQHREADNQICTGTSLVIGVGTMYY
jgi:hypothetical protein